MSLYNIHAISMSLYARPIIITFVWSPQLHASHIVKYNLSSLRFICSILSPPFGPTIAIKKIRVPMHKRHDFLSKGTDPAPFHAISRQS